MQTQYFKVQREKFETSQLISKVTSNLKNVNFSWSISSKCRTQKHLWMLFRTQNTNKCNGKITELCIIHLARFVVLVGHEMIWFDEHPNLIVDLVLEDSYTI